MMSMIVNICLLNINGQSRKRLHNQINCPVSNMGFELTYYIETLPWLHNTFLIFFTEFTDFFKNLNDEQKAQFKTQVLTLLQNEANAQMRRKLVDLVAEVSRNLMDDDGKNF